MEPEDHLVRLKREAVLMRGMRGASDTGLEFVEDLEALINEVEQWRGSEDDPDKMG